VRGREREELYAGLEVGKRVECAHEEMRWEGVRFGWGLEEESFVDEGVCVCVF
jgi:hypothetical protein